MKLRLFHKKPDVIKDNIKKYYMNNNKLIVIHNDGTKTINPTNINIYISANNSSNNRIVLYDSIYKNNIKFNFFNSNNNKIVIGKNNEIDIDFRVQGNNGILNIGDNNYICSAILYFYCSGKTIFTIGNGNLFSEQVIFWAGEGHSVIDAKSKKITNIGSSITIGNNNWICMKSCFLKHARISNGCIIGYGSTITKSFDTDNCIIAGNPAVIVKKDILWSEQSPWTYDGRFYRQIKPE